MRSCCLITFAAISVILLAGCTTSRQYLASHDRLVEAGVYAISVEAAVKPEQVKRTDREEKGGRLTVLEAPYIEYSRIQVFIDSRGEYASAPELGVLITTDKDKGFYTRHKDMEERVHELAVLNLRARQHGAESKPTSLPPATPKAAEPKPQPAPAPQPEAKK